MSRRVQKKLIEEEKQLYFAISKDNQEQLKQLIEKGIDVDKTFNGSNQWGKSALHLCCEMGRLECARALVKAGACTDPQDEWYQTPLMYSVCTERADMVEFLLGVGCFLGIQDRYGKTALHFAIKNSELDCLRLLIEGGAPINSCDENGRSPLWLAVTVSGRDQVIKLLLQSGADVNQKDWRLRCTPLQAAIHDVTDDTLTYIRLLLEHRAEVNTIDAFGQTLLTTLLRRKTSARAQQVSARDLDIARELVKAGLDVNLVPVPRNPNKNHATALGVASCRGALSFVTVLLEAGADPDIGDYYNVTPVMYAAFGGHYDIVKLLLTINCKTNVTGSVTVGQERILATPLQCAIFGEHWDIADLFIFTNYDLSRDSYLFTNENVPDALVRNFEFWGVLRDLATNCLKLSELCRLKIRRLLGHKLQKSVQYLPIPPSLKNFVLISDVLSPVE